MKEITLEIRYFMYMFHIACKTSHHLVNYLEILAFQCFQGLCYILEMKPFQSS